MLPQVHLNKLTRVDLKKMYIVSVWTRPVLTGESFCFLMKHLRHYEKVTETVIFLSVVFLAKVTFFFSLRRDFPLKHPEEQTYVIVYKPF